MKPSSSGRFATLGPMELYARPFVGKLNATREERDVNGEFSMHKDKSTGAKRKQLRDLAQDLRANISKSDDPRLKALYETSAEVLLGLEKAMADFEKREEAAWRD